MTAPQYDADATLPPGVLRVGDLGSAMQGLNGTKVTETTKGRMVGNFLATPGGFAGGPIDFLVGLLGQFLGNIADDANDITLEGPQDLPDLIHDFFADLPLVGIIIDIFDAMLGTYDGDDPVLNGIQNLFALIRRFLELITNPVGALTDVAPTVVTQFFSNLQKYMQGITVTSDPAEFFTGLGNVAQNLIDKIAQGLGSSGAGHSVDDVRSLLSLTAGRLDEVEAAITNLNDVAAATSVTPAYVADLEDMATALRSQLAWPSVASGAAATTGGASGNTAAYTGSTLSGHVHGLNSHTHSVPAHSHTVSVVMPTYTPDRVFGSSTAYVDFTPCWADRRGNATTVSWVVGADTSIFSIDAYYMGLMIYNPDNGNLEKVWDSGDIKNGVANTTTLQEVILDMALVDQTYTPGQLLFLAHQQIAPGLVQAARSFACVPQAGIGRPSSWTDSHGVVHERLLDAASYRSPSRLGSIPASISFSSLTRVNTRIPWGALGVNTEAV